MMVQQGCWWSCRLYVCSHITILSNDPKLFSGTGCSVIQQCCSWYLVLRGTSGMVMDGIWVMSTTGKSNSWRFSFSYLTLVLSGFTDFFIVSGFRYIHILFACFYRETLLSCWLFAVSWFNEKSIVGTLFCVAFLFVFVVFVCFPVQLGVRQCSASGFGWQVTVKEILWPQRWISVAICPILAGQLVVSLFALT